MSDKGMKKCTLEEILEAREDRVRRREALQKKTRCPVVSMTMNIPGAVKDSPMIRTVFHLFMRDHWVIPIINGAYPLAGRGTSGAEELYEKTGPESLEAFRVPAREIKRICIEVEESDPVGRLFDFDVYDEEGNAISRTDLGFPERSCIVCGAPGRTCASRQLHPIGEVRAKAEKLMKDYLLRVTAGNIAYYAERALELELYVTPKPGLVDRRNQGSHKDMDLSLMEKSARSLRPYFTECICIGMKSAEESPEETFKLLNRAGREAEKTMFSVTGGVNTHKGAVYLFGIVLGALGRLLKQEVVLSDEVFSTLKEPACEAFPVPEALPEIEELLAEGGRIARKAALRDLGKIRDIPEEERTAGQRIFLQHGISGARGEAAEGFPSVRKVALPFLREHEEEDDALPRLLLRLITLGKDTNLIARGGFEGACEAVKKTWQVFEREAGEEAIEALDDWFIERNLSPGGSADLLALTIFLRDLECAKAHSKEMLLKGSMLHNMLFH